MNASVQDTSLVLIQKLFDIFSANIFSRLAFLGAALGFGYMLFAIIRILTTSVRATGSGRSNENKTAAQLTRLFSSAPIRNILLPDGKGGTTELDMALPTTKGILCIESKYRSGDLIAGYYMDNWDVRRNGMSVGSLLNPFIQNQGHIMALTNTLGRYKCLNIVQINQQRCTFLERGQELQHTGLTNRLDTPNAYALVSSGSGLKLLKAATDRLPDIYHPLEVQRIRSMLEARVGTKKQLKEHKEYVTKKHRR